MESVSKVYSVMPGEPHLGKVRETTYTYDKDDIIEAMVEAIEDDGAECEPEASFTLGEEDYEFSEMVSKKECDAITWELGRLLDDDWGTNKPTDIITKHLDAYIHKSTTIEQEGQEYGC